MELIVGKTYRAKRPTKRFSFMLGEHYNDRTIVWMGSGLVQYDGPTVKIGSKYPCISEDKFLAWAGSML